MFQVNRSDNRLVRLEERRFADLDLRERDHLQEWLVRMPDALGEDLLIVQKEFDGFADTRERLDLLALDKEGQLVVIENKLDDSGRDVVWQALKYVAYCSSLQKAEIVEIYQKYLDRWSEGAKAVTNLCEFLDVEELDDMVLNTGNEQRLVLIAANFRKEVTATVLWLLGHGVRAQCFRVVPYSFGKELFIDLQQIIPTPEAADYMIGMAAKDSEEKSLQGVQERSHRLRNAFWTRALEELRARNVSRFENISPSNEHWLSCATGVSNCTTGPDPLSWTPNPCGRRSPRCQDQGSRIRRSFASSWSRWFVRDVRRRIWPESLNRQPTRSATGWPRPIAMRAGGPTA